MTPPDAPQAAPPPTSPPSRPGSTRRSWVVVALLCSLLLLGGWAARAWLTAAAKDYLHTALAEQLGLNVAVDHLEIQFVPSALILNGVRVAGPDQEPAPLLDAAAITFRFSLLSLLSDQFILDRVTLDAPRVTLTPARADWIARRLRRDDTRPGALSLRRLAVEQGSLLYADDARTISVAVNRLSAVVDMGLLAAPTLDVSEGEAIVEIGDWRQALSITGRATLSSDRLTLHELVAQNPDVKASLNGALTFEAAPAMQLTLTASFPLGELSPWLPAGHQWSGTVGLHTEISGAWPPGQEAGSKWAQLSQAIALTGTVNGSGLAVDDLPLGTLTAPFELREGRLAITGLTGTLLEGPIRGDLTTMLPPAAPHVTADLTLSRHQIGPVMRRLVPAAGMPAGRLSGRVTAQGREWTLDQLVADGALTFTAEPDDGPPPASVPAPTAPLPAALGHLAEGALQFHWRAPWLELTHAIATTRRKNQVESRGTIERNGPLALSVDARITDLRELGEWAAATGIKPLTSWEGAMRGRGTIAGVWSDPHVTAELTLDALTSRGESIDEGHAALLYRARTITLKEIALHQGPGRVTGGGTIALARADAAPAGAPQFQMTFNVTDSDLGRLLRFLGVKAAIEGRADGTLALTGAPKHFRLHGPAHVRDGTLFGQPIADARLTMTLTSDAIEFSRLRFTDGPGTVDATGRIGFDGSYTVDAVITALPVERLHWAATHAPQLAGRLDGRVTGAGAWDQPQLRAQLELQDLTAGPSALGRGAVGVILTGRRLDVTASLQDPEMVFSGAVHLRDDLPATAHLTVARFPLALLLRPFMPRWPEAVTVLASGSGELSGSLRRPADLSGYFEFSDFAARLADYPIANDGPLALRMQGGRVTIERARLSGEGTTLAVEGGLTLFERYDLFIHGESELAMLRLFFPKITYSRGKGYLALQITDRWLDPKMAGGVNLQDALIRLDAINEPLTIAYAGLFFDGRQLMLDNLSGAIGKGAVQASGRMVFERFVPVNYRLLLEMAGVAFAPIKGFSGVVDGSLWFQGAFADEAHQDVTEGDRHVLKGDLEVVLATYSKRIDLKSLLADRPSVEALELSVPPFLQDVTLQVRLRGRQAIWINNNLANIPLELDLDVRGTIEHPVLLGRISTTSGTFNFLQTPFQVSSGSIDFLDPRQTRAVTDLKAHTAVREYTVDLSLIGTEERVTLELTSDPPLSEADIFSLLTVGRTTDEVATAGAGQVATSGAAALLVDEFFEEGAQQIGIDRLQVDSAVDRSGTVLGPQLTIGKRWMDNRLLVLVSWPLDPTVEAPVRLEYDINRYMSLVGERDESGRFGGDLKFRFEFR